MSEVSPVRRRASWGVICCALTILCGGGLLIQAAHADDSSLREKTEHVAHETRAAVHRAGQDLKHAGREVGDRATKFGRKVADSAKSAGKDIGHGAREAGVEVKKTTKRTARAVKRDIDSHK